MTTTAVVTHVLKGLGKSFDVDKKYSIITCWWVEEGKETSAVIVKAEIN